MVGLLLEIINKINRPRPMDRLVVLRAVQESVRARAGTLSPYLDWRPLLARVANGEDFSGYPGVNDKPDSGDRFFLEDLRAWAEEDLDSQLQHLEDLMWDLVCLKTDIPCPFCRNVELRCLWDPAEKRIVLNCFDCGWMQDEDGARWEAAAGECVFLAPATVDELKKAGY